MAYTVEQQVFLSLILYDSCPCSGTEMFDSCFNLQKLNLNVSLMIMLDTQDRGGLYLGSHQMHTSGIACKTLL